jgi:hypothetical protein
VAPVQACGGRTSLQPHPEESAANPDGHGMLATGAHVVDPSVAIVPAGQSFSGMTGLHPMPSGKG